MLGLKRKVIDDTVVPDENVVGTYHPDFLIMDYQRRRKEHRLIYVFSVTIEYEGEQYQAKTKDISTNGLKLILPDIKVNVGDIINITLDYFVEEQKLYTDDSKKGFFKSIVYEVISIEHKNRKTFVGLEQKDLNDIAKEHIYQFIKINRLQFKIDPIDVYLASQAQFIQHTHTYNLPSIPLFISKTEDPKQPYTVDYFIETRKNKSLIKSFCNTHHGNLEADLSSFMLPNRLLHFSSPVFLHKTRLLFIYWENAQLYTVCDFELKDKEAIAVVVNKVLQQQGTIFSITSQTVIHPDEEILAKRIEHLHIPANQEKTQELLESVKQYHTQLLLTDITHIYQGCSEFLSSAPLDIDVQVSRANEKVILNSGEVVKKQRLNLTKPKKIMLNVQEQRHSVRYIHTMPVILSSKTDDIEAETLDFSIEGIGVKFPFDPTQQLSKNDYIQITFPLFDKQVKNIDFTDIDFKIAGVVHKNDHVILGLVRLPGQKSDKVGSYIENLINKNKTKLTIDENNTFEQVSMIIFQSYLGMRIDSIPLIMGNDKVNKRYIKQVGLNEQACQLSDYFKLNNADYNFKILTSKSRLRQYFNRTMRASSDKDQSFVLFMYKAVNEKGIEYLNSYTSYGLEDELTREAKNNILAENGGESSEELDEITPIIMTRQEFFNELFEHNGVCIQFNFVNGLVLDSDYIRDIIDHVAQINRYAGQRFKSYINNTFGYAEMTDVTLAYHSLFR